MHTPEFAFEKDPDNVRRAVSELGIAYPVALDNNYKVWEAFKNDYWPADYLVDTTGRIRHHQFGEGGYEESERQIQALLKERDGVLSSSGLVTVTGTGAEAPSANDIKSPETYVGYDRAENVVSPGGLKQDAAHLYSVPKHLELNQWGFSAIGWIKLTLLAWFQRRAESFIVFMRGICILYSDLRRMESGSGSGSVSTVRRPAKITEPIRTSGEQGELQNTVCTS